MASCLIPNLWEEMKCPICQDFFTYAVSIECGHNFCARCIHELCQKTSKSLFPCPKCQKECIKNFWPNRQLETVTQYFKLLTPHMIRNYKLRDEIKKNFHEEITLDPGTVYPGIIWSKDMKTMKRKRDLWVKFPILEKKLDACGAVLATQGFTSGRHYWEVTVGKSSAWDVGLCKNSVERIGKVLPSSFTGYWLLSLRQNTYTVCTMPRIKIPLARKLIKVGIFLDYEVGDIVFYDVDSNCLIYKFTSSFSEPLWPVFSIGLNSKKRNILTIDPISAESTETPEHVYNSSLETSFSDAETVTDSYTYDLYWEPEEIYLIL